jgi:hypothetical protein
MIMNHMRTVSFLVPLYHFGMVRCCIPFWVIYIYCSMPELLTQMALSRFASVQSCGRWSELSYIPCETGWDKFIDRNLGKPKCVVGWGCRNRHHSLDRAVGVKRIRHAPIDQFCVPGNWGCLVSDRLCPLADICSGHLNISKHPTNPASLRINEMMGIRTVLWTNCLERVVGDAWFFD